MQSMYVVVMLAEPLVLGGAIALLWGRSLGETWRRRRRALFPSLAGAVATIAIASVAFGALRTTPPAAEPAFPATELRTSFAPPKIDLIDHEGKRVTLESLRGKVVLITGIYSSCATACPMITAQVRRVVSSLSPEERAQLVVLAVTLDPERDDLERRAAMSKTLMMARFHVLGGDPAEVRRVLDDLSIARTKNPETGVIDHANVFTVVDKKGTLAYRFTLGDLQEKWLAESIRMLGKE
jgi:protein SCO1/2